MTAVGPWWLPLWVEAVARPSQAVELDTAALLLAAHGCSSLHSPADIERQRQRLDAIAARAEAGTFDHWHRLLFVTYGFGGDGDTYHDSRNSFLPDVLDRRRGIPISLSVVAMEVGRRLGVTVEGVGMPGHFLVRAVGAQPMFVDPFNGGQILDEDGCRERFAQMFGDGRPFSRQFLAPVSTHMILVRMLNNLKSDAARRRDLITLCDIMRMRWHLPGVSVDEGRELVRLLTSTGNHAEGVEVLERLGGEHPQAEELLAAERRRLDLILN